MRCNDCLQIMNEKDRGTELPRIIYHGNKFTIYMKCGKCGWSQSIDTGMQISLIQSHMNPNEYRADHSRRDFTKKIIIGMVESFMLIDQKKILDSVKVKLKLIDSRKKYK